VSGSVLRGPVQLGKGTRAHILALTDARLAEPFFATDTGEFFMGWVDGVPRPITGMKGDPGMPGMPGPSGTPGSPGGVRSTVVYTSGTIAPGGYEVGSFVTPAGSFFIGRDQTNYPARVRIYLSQAYRDADLARLVSQEAQGDHGCVLEDITTPAFLSLHCKAAEFFSLTGALTAWITVENNDTVARVITVTLDLLSIEGF
jgi:hypothetical protein